MLEGRYETLLHAVISADFFVLVALIEFELVCRS